MKEEKKETEAKVKHKEVGDLELELASAIKTAEENLTLAKYQKAELENYKKRHAGAVENAFTDGKAFVIISILPIIDSLTEALKIITTPKEREGIEMLGRKFTGILTDIGVEEIKTEIGAKFDPYVHYAAATEPADGKESGIIVQVWQKGYKLSGKVLRPATVKVSG